MASTKATGGRAEQAPRSQGAHDVAPLTRSPGLDSAPGYWRTRHDPRLDPPTKADRRRLLAWVAFLALTPICLGVVVWAAVGLNGNYPTVAAPVPAGWQAVPGIYASFSAPKNWSLQQFMSDAAGDIYYSGRGGSVGESVTAATVAPRPAALPAIVGTYLGTRYSIVARVSVTLRNATKAWRYTFRLAGGGTGLGVLAWVKPTQSRVWLIALPASATTERVLSTLTLAP